MFDRRKNEDEEITLSLREWRKLLSGESGAPSRFIWIWECPCTAPEEHFPGSGSLDLQPDQRIHADRELLHERALLLPELRPQSQRTLGRPGTAGPEPASEGQERHQERRLDIRCKSTFARSERGSWIQKARAGVCWFIKNEGGKERAFCRRGGPSKPESLLTVRAEICRQHSFQWGGAAQSQQTGPDPGKVQDTCPPPQCVCLHMCMAVRQHFNNANTLKWILKSNRTLEASI